VNTDIQILKVWLKYVLPLLKYAIFLGDGFLWTYPIDCMYT